MRCHLFVSSLQQANSSAEKRDDTLKKLHGRSKSKKFVEIDEESSEDEDFMLLSFDDESEKGNAMS